MANKLFPFLVTGILLVVAGNAYGQQKIGYVSSEAILDRLGDAKAARARLNEMQAGWMREIQRQGQEIEKVQEDIRTNRLIWSAQEKRDAESKLADLESKLAAYRQSKFGPKQEFENQQNELMGPVIDKVTKAIEDEAKAQKYDYVFDKSSRGMPMLFSNPALDLTWPVLKRLGVDPSDSVTSGVDASRPELDARSEDDARRRRGSRSRGTEPVDPNKALDPASTSPIPVTPEQVPTPK